MVSKVVSTSRKPHILSQLPAKEGLSELILVKGAPEWIIQIRTEEGAVWFAPQDARHGISWGYPDGDGPVMLAYTVDLLLKSINAVIVHDLAAVRATPNGLKKLTRHKWPNGTVIYRKQLEAARDGRFNLALFLRVLPQIAREAIGYFR